MKTSLRLLTAGTIVMSLLFGAATAYPSLAVDSGLDFWNIDEYERQWNSSRAAFEQADRDIDIILNRIATKEEIIDDLLAGRITFEDAAERFAVANLSMKSSHLLIRKYQGANHSERSAWQLIGFLKKGRGPAALQLGEEWECILIGRSSDSSVDHGQR